MLFRRYRFQIVVRTLLIVATSFLLSYVVLYTSYFYAPIALALTIPFQILSLIRYSEKAIKDLDHFLQSIRQADFTQGLSSAGRGPLYEDLHHAFNEVMEEFRRIRSEKEEHFRYVQTVVQHIGIALIAFRRDGHFELINVAAKRLLGRGQLRNIQQLREWNKTFVQTLLELDSGQHAVIKTLHDDEERQLAIYASRFRLRDETHTLVSIQDIRNELEEKEMEAWQSLTRVLTHEIMNSAAPIASLAATASHLLQSKTSDDGTYAGAETIADTHEALEAIERRSQALIHFADSYRSFTQIRKPNFRVFPVKSLFVQVRRLMRVQAEDTSIDVRVSVTPDDLKLTADEEFIEQVIINLLLNAMDALQGRQDARIELRAGLDRQSRPTIQVADNGPGIPSDIKERIFIPFFTTKRDGSGIGLSLSRQIMRLHNGTINVRSEKDVETVFTLRF